MSTIAVDNARPSAGGTSYSLTSGVAKAWCSANVSAVVSDSYNVSSVTDVATARFSLNLTNSFVNADYSVAIGTELNTLLDMRVSVLEVKTTSETPYKISRVSNGTLDESSVEDVMPTINGDLA